MKHSLNTAHLLDLIVLVPLDLQLVLVLLDVGVVPLTLHTHRLTRLLAAVGPQLEDVLRASNK